MALYHSTSGIVESIVEHPFQLESELQRLVEANLTQLMNLELVKREFTIKNRRIDTLAYDLQTNAFVIIEYKRDKNYSVVDQGFTYLGLMLENKADFIVEYNESRKPMLKRDHVDWSQSRVIFVSTGFTDTQIQASNYKDLPIELWEAKRYENDIVSIQQIKKTSSAESIKPLTQKSSILKKVAEEITVYTEQYHLREASELIQELYTRFKSAILALADGIEVKPQKAYIAFKKARNITDVVILRKSIKIFINLHKGDLKDPRKLARDVSRVGHWGNGDYEIIVNSDKDIEYIMSLIKQSL